MQSVSRNYKIPKARSSKVKRGNLGKARGQLALLLSEEPETVDPEPGMYTANAKLFLPTLLLELGWDSFIFLETSRASAPTPEPQPDRPDSATERKFNLINEALSDKQQEENEVQDESCVQRTPSIESDTGDSGDFTMVHKSFWSTFVKNLLCKQCQDDHLTVKVTEEHGFVKKMIVKCKSCGVILTSVYTSPRVSDDKKESKRPPFTLNKRMCDTVLDAGKG